MTAHAYEVVSGMQFFNKHVKRQSKAMQYTNDRLVFLKTNSFYLIFSYSTTKNTSECRASESL